MGLPWMQTRGTARVRTGDWTWGKKAMEEIEVNVSIQSLLRVIIISSVKEEEFCLGGDTCETLVSHLCENWAGGL